jgi:uncharacterized ferredoxin-like protein
MNKTIEESALLDVARFMCVAARTAPKAKGIDNIVTAIVEGSGLEKLAAKMRYFAQKENKPGFARDADGIAKSACTVLIGTKIAPVGLTFCGFCGWPDCETMTKKGGICAYNPLDLGIAIGSAISVAADFRADNRVMYSAGLTAVKMGLLGDKVKLAIAIPLSATGKNIFFDRK